MRFLIAALIAIAFNFSAYGQKSTEQQLVELLAQAAALQAQVAALQAQIEADREGQTNTQTELSQECFHSHGEASDTERFCELADSHSVMPNDDLPSLYISRPALGGWVRLYRVNLDAYAERVLINAERVLINERQRAENAEILQQWNEFNRPLLN